MKELLQKLIRARSTLDVGELAAAQVLAEYFTAHGIEAAVDRWDDNRANVTAFVRGTGELPALLFACHLDVVPAGNEPWKDDPFSGAEVEGSIYGRGSVDMKGGTAASAAAIARMLGEGFRPKGDIIFTSTAGEETDSRGAYRFAETFTPDRPIAGVIIPEPTDFDIVTAHRGMLWLQITTHGKSAHSSMPHLGINAVLAMKQIMDRLCVWNIPFDRHQLLGDCSMSINRISGGQAMNIVPDLCTLGIDIRTVPGQMHDALQAEIRDIIDDLVASDPQFKADLSVIRSVEAMETDSNCDFVRRFCSAVDIPETTAVGFTTDGPHFAQFGAPVLIFGPGRPDRCHKPDESITIADLQRAQSAFSAVITEFLG